MLGDDVSRPYSYGRSRDKNIDLVLFYKKFEIRYDLIVSDQEVEGYLNLSEIFRETRDDDHADELRKETNWEENDVDHNRIEEAYVESENPEKTDYPMLLRLPEHENQDTAD
jgi:hypothetical protein